MRINKIVDPSIPVNCRAFQECDEAEFVVVAAIQAIHWTLDPDHEAGLDMICRALPKVSKRTIERAVARLKKKALIGTDRRFGHASRFGLNFESLSFADLRAALLNRQVGGIGDAPLNRQVGGIESAKLAELVRQVGGVINSTDSKEKTKTPTAKAAPSESDSWIAEFEKRWTSKFNAPCHFKSKASSKAIQELQAKGITAAEFCARTDRYLALDDAYIRNNGYSLHGFLAWRWNQLFIEGAGADPI